MDGGPTLATDFLIFDPITPGAFAPFFDHSIGNDSTANGGGAEAGDAGNLFIFDDTYWGLNMKAKGLSPGHYTLSVVSGDATEYQVDPTCEVGVSIQ